MADRDRDERRERDRDDEREERRERRRKDPTEELIEDEVEALERVMEDIEHLPIAAQMRVLRAGETLLPPAPPVTPGTPPMTTR